MMCYPLELVIGGSQPAAQQCAAPDDTCPGSCALREAVLAGVAGELGRWAARHSRKVE